MPNPRTPNAEPPGAWVFVSHSNRDIVAVRAVRDELERMGHQPLLFFLKCINDHDELDELIKREIDARNFFLLCDSAAARGSDWVRQEVAYIQSLPNRIWHTVNLEADPKEQLRAIRELSRQATVFLSYARIDWHLVAPLHDALVAAEYCVWGNEGSYTSVESWQGQIREALSKALLDGFVLLFLSPDSLASAWCRREILTALQLAAEQRYGSSRIIPVIPPGDPVSLDSLPEELRFMEFLDLSGLAPSQAGVRLIRHLRHKD